MTIAACYVSPEGIVLGADSASTYVFPSGNHHFNYGQKIFEIGTDSTLGIVTWGLGGLALGSYRTIAAKLGDLLRQSPPGSVLDVAVQWVDLVWPTYSTLPDVKECELLEAKFSYDSALPPDTNRRTEVEELQLGKLKQDLVVGFCIGGYVQTDRTPSAFEMIFDPISGKPYPNTLPMSQSFWGVPALINRLIFGCGDEVFADILSSGKWVGTQNELVSIIAKHQLVHPPTVPIREAIDFTHACLMATIKAIKFSLLPRVCGGPIELAVITTDRMFRWVQHKTFDAAILELDP